MGSRVARPIYLVVIALLPQIGLGPLLCSLSLGSAEMTMNNIYLEYVDKLCPKNKIKKVVDKEFHKKFSNILPLS